jgi:hypothetical protein
MLLPPHTQLPLWQMALWPSWPWHAWSTSGSSSTMPLQSLSKPSQISGA